ncbi:hypothetical protein QQ045_026798 [Rhodiola kirilowii]
MHDIIRSALQQDAYHTAKFLCGDISYVVMWAEFSPVTNFGKATCLSSCISWNPCRDESQPSNFVVGFSSDIHQLIHPSRLDHPTMQVWEFDDAHHRWLPVAELASPEDNGDRITAVAWASNIGRNLLAVSYSNSADFALDSEAIRILQ